MNMYNTYQEFYNKYTAVYGKKTAIFLMVGSFYELYDIVNKTTGETRCNIRDVIDILGIQLTVKKNDIDEDHDGLFSGFPDYVMHKWAGKLTQSGWTVVIVDQIKDDKNKVIERKVSRILSPSTHIESTPSSDTPFIASIYLEPDSDFLSPPNYGVAMLDLTTGHTTTYSGKANGKYDTYSADELNQMLSVFLPKEIVLYWKEENKQLDHMQIRKILNINSDIPLYIRVIDSLGSFSKQLVRKEYLQSAYSIKSLLPPNEYLGLRSLYEELCLLFLLQFTEEHIPGSIKLLHKNSPYTPSNNLICGNHALTQLQMLSQSSNECLLSLFNKCITPMGKRAIKERLLQPKTDPKKIIEKLNEIKELQSWEPERIKKLETCLRFMFDIPRLHRKLLCGTIQDSEIAHIFQTYNSTQTLISEIVQKTSILAPAFSLEIWADYVNEFKKHFDEDKSLKTSEDVTPFNNHNKSYEKIKNIEYNIKKEKDNINEIINEISKKTKIAPTSFIVEEKDKGLYGIRVTKTTMDALSKSQLPENIKLVKLKSGGHLETPELEKVNINIQKLRHNLKKESAECLAFACNQLSAIGYNLWTPVESWLSNIDCTYCISKVSQENCFVMPEIIDNADDSHINIKCVRHPLVEKAASRVKYVTHDISLGNINSNGWLVYGMNASGKSTLMKATGLAVLLAQAGCFVPAKSMKLAPFKAIYTRILNQDNIFSGLSSFAVEMSELRDILNNSNKYTLVLGDELCAGTESISAQALIASGIQWLSKRNTKFIFATHLHDLPQIINTEALNVSIWHLHVHYDPITKKLIYDRQLRQGPGSSIYGLEVARAMDLPMEFIEAAIENRHKIIGSTTLQAAKSSNWNKDIIRKECEICKKNVTSELEVHHIVERNSAKNNKIDDGTSVHSIKNLIVVCQSCHDKHHNGEIQIGNLVQTSMGQEREIIYNNLNLPKSSDQATSLGSQEYRGSQGSQEISVNNKTPKNNKYREEELIIIKNMVSEYKNLSLKVLKNLLYQKYDISISEANIGKIRKEIVN